MAMEQTLAPAVQQILSYFLWSICCLHSIPAIIQVNPEKTNWGSGAAWCRISCLHSIPAIKHVNPKKTDLKLQGRLVQDIPSPCGLDPTGTLNGHQSALSYSTCWVAARNADWNNQTKQQFRDEVRAIVAETAAHPSIIGYIVSPRNLDCITSIS